MRINEMHAELAALKRQVADYTNGSGGEAGSSKKSRSGIKKSIANSDAANDDARMTANTIRRLGGKFVIMYRLWISNTRSAFHTELSPDYTPLDGLTDTMEWRRQAEHADLLKVFPREFHADFSGDFIHPTVSFSPLHVYQHVLIFMDI